MDNIIHQINRNTHSKLSLKAMGGAFQEGMRKLFSIGRDFKESQRGTRELEDHPAAANSDAVFIGWQKTPWGEAFPLYNVIAKNHPLFCSTVSDQTLRKRSIKIPPTPPFKET